MLMEMAMSRYRATIAKGSEDEEEEQEEEEKMSQLRTFDCVPLSVNLHMH